MHFGCVKLVEQQGSTRFSRRARLATSLSDRESSDDSLKLSLELSNTRCSTSAAFMRALRTVLLLDAILTANSTVHASCKYKQKLPPSADYLWIAHPTIDHCISLVKPLLSQSAVSASQLTPMTSSFKGPMWTTPIARDISGGALIGVKSWFTDRMTDDSLAYGLRLLLKYFTLK